MQRKIEKSEDSLYIRVIGFALKYYSQEGFNYSNIVESTKLDLKSWEKNIITRNFNIACFRYNLSDTTKGETIFSFVHGDHTKPNSEENKYILTFEAEFSFIDYQELKFARENAKEAKSLSWKAIWISVFAIIISVLIPFLVSSLITQNITIDGSQFQEIKNTIDSQVSKVEFYQ